MPFKIPSIWMTIAGIILFALALLKAYGIGFSYGSAKADTQISAIKIQMEQEYSGQLEKLIQSEKKAKQHEATLIEQLQEAESKIDELMEQNKAEAASDPDKDKCGISGKSSERINRVR
jgi:hypothetical protein